MVVLSNNDGCAIARSEEAKALGIAMCQPYFQFQQLEKIGALVVFSANFSLYSDISNRIMSRLGGVVGPLEQYSVDECFFVGERTDSFRRAESVRRLLLQELSIPVSIGIGRTKTEAKLATRCSKKEKAFQGICDLISLTQDHKRLLYEMLPPSALWGINTRTEEKLKKRGVFSVDHLLKTPLCLLRKWGGVSLEKIALELQGISCHQVEEEGRPQKSLMHSRTFMQPLFALDDMKETVSQFACRSAEELRKQ